MSCLFNQSLSVYQGNSRTLRVTVYDENGDLEDLTGSTAYFTVRQKVISTATVIAKVSTTPADITILPQTGDTLGQFDVNLVPADTNALPVDAPFTYDVWVELASGDRYTVVPPSTFLILPAVTKL